MTVLGKAFVLLVENMPVAVVKADNEALAVARLEAAGWAFIVFEGYCARAPNTYGFYPASFEEVDLYEAGALPQTD